MPEHIFIYRDGVGDSMRQMVIDEEMRQLHKIVATEYSHFQKEKAAASTPEGDAPVEDYKPPEITLIIVNKRVR